MNLPLVAFGISDIDPVAALKYGVLGLIFLLAALAYGLLSAEQKKSPPSATMLGTIRTFLYITVALALIAGAVEVWERVYDHKQQVTVNAETVTRLQGEITRLQNQLDDERSKGAKALVDAQAAHDLAIHSAEARFESDLGRQSQALVALQAENKQFARDATDLRDRLAATKSDLAVVNSQLDLLRTLANGSESPNQIVSRIRDNTAELERLRPLPAQLATITAEGRDLAAKVAELTTDLAQIAGATGVRGVVPGQLTSAVVAQLNELSALRPEHQQLINRNAELTRQVEQLKLQVDGLQQRVDPLTQQLATALEANRQLNLRIASLEKDVEEWRGIAKQYISKPPTAPPPTPGELKTAISALQREATQAKSHADEAQQALFAMEMTLNQTKARYAALLGGESGVLSAAAAAVTKPAASRAPASAAPAAGGK